MGIRIDLEGYLHTMFLLWSLNYWFIQKADHAKSAGYVVLQLMSQLLTFIFYLMLTKPVATNNSSII